MMIDAFNYGQGDHDMESPNSPHDRLPTETSMQAITRKRYGLPDVLSLSEVDIPQIDADQILIKVHASSVNAAEWHMMTGIPYLVHLESGLRRPKRPGLGADVAGTVVETGADVTQFNVGDSVFAEVASGSYAEYAAAREKNAAHKPTNMTFEQTAAVPTAGLTALQGLRDIGRLEPGQHVLINGASGGVGTFAVQVAKALGAQVTAVCSSRNVDAASRLGADHVIDYTQRNFTEGGEQYDLMFDIVALGSISDCIRVLKPSGRYVVVGGPKRKWLGPLGRLLRAKLAFAARSQTMGFFIAKADGGDLAFLAELMESGRVVPEIEATYPLSEVPAALRRFGKGHVKGKIVIAIA